MEVIKVLSEFIAYFLIWVAIDYKRVGTVQRVFTKGFWVQTALLVTAIIILKWVFKA